MRKARYPAGLSFYETGLLERYFLAKFKPIPFDYAVRNFNRNFLEALTDVEAALISRSDIWSGGEAVRKRIRIVQRARLIARRLGIKYETNGLV